MNKLRLYEYCKTQRDENALDWVTLHKQAVKEKIITAAVSLPELRSIYRDVAGRLAAGELVVEPGGYDGDTKEFFKFIGKTHDAFEVREKADLPEKQISIIVTDWHVPYHDMDKVQAIIDKWGGKAHRLIIGGDYLNGTQLSTHPKMIVEDFRQECSQGRALLELLASVFPEVVMVDDNHVHSRWMRYISKALSPDLFFLTVHPYDYLCAGLPNVIRASATHNFELKEEIGWFYVIGDALISHAESSSAVDMRPARAVAAYMEKWAPVYNLPKIRFVAQAHNHKLGIVHDVDSAVAMTGCVVGLKGLEYSFGAHIKSAPPVHGYVVLVQENGVTNLEETTVVKLPLRG